LTKCFAIDAERIASDEDAALRDVDAEVSQQRLRELECETRCIGGTDACESADGRRPDVVESEKIAAAGGKILRDADVGGAGFRSRRLRLRCHRPFHAVL